MINITITTNEGVKKQINIRKTLSGDYILREHPEIDIFVIPTKQKVLALPKDEQTDNVYSLQERLFDYLSKKGVVLPETVIGGNIYGSLQAGYAAQPPGTTAAHPRRGGLLWVGGVGGVGVSHPPGLTSRCRGQTGATSRWPPHGLRKRPHPCR